MGLKIYWTHFARNELKNIFDYYKEHVSPTVAKMITKELAKSAEILIESPRLGKLEELLKERPQKFRYLVSSNYKLIYWINSDEKRIEIVDIFDTRQDPVKIKRNK